MELDFLFHFIWSLFFCLVWKKSISNTLVATLTHFRSLFNPFGGFYLISGALHSILLNSTELYNLRTSSSTRKKKCNFPILLMDLVFCATEKSHNLKVEPKKKRKKRSTKHLLFLHLQIFTESWAKNECPRTCGCTSSNENTFSCVCHFYNYYYYHCYRQQAYSWKIELRNANHEFLFVLSFCFLVPSFYYCTTMRTLSQPNINNYDNYNNSRGIKEMRDKRQTKCHNDSGLISGVKNFLKDNWELKYFCHIFRSYFTLANMQSN